MTFVPGSDPDEFWALIGGVAAMVGSLQWWSHRQQADPGRVISRCADGSVIGARDPGVRRRPGHARGRGLGLRARLRHATNKVREDLEPGDLTDVRIREGRAGESSWVVEGLDRAPEPFSIHWEFETPEAALAAYRLLEERIVRRPLDAEPLDELEFDALWAREGLATGEGSRTGSPS